MVNKSDENDVDSIKAKQRLSPIQKILSKIFTVCVIDTYAEGWDWSY